jgi:hypothetical protein
LLIPFIDFDALELINRASLFCNTILSNILCFFLICSNTHNTFSPLEILEKYNPEESGLGMELREYLFASLKDIQETPDVSANIIGYGYGPGYKDMICTIIPSKKGIKLGFNRGSELPDPQKLLTGSGKVHKYVEIKSSADINSEALSQLLEEAMKAFYVRVGK